MTALFLINYSLYHSSLVGIYQAPLPFFTIRLKSIDVLALDLILFMILPLIPAYLNGGMKRCGRALEAKKTGGRGRNKKSRHRAKNHSQNVRIKAL